MLLHRNNAPKNWCPPCGRLEIGEQILDGLRREVEEETGLIVESALPVEIWQGDHNDLPTLSISYACFASDNKVILSSEHSKYLWVPVHELKTTKIVTDFEVKKWPLYFELAKLSKSSNGGVPSRKFESDCHEDR